MYKNKGNYLYYINILFYKLLIINRNLLTFKSNIIIINISFIQKRINIYKINCYII